MARRMLIDATHPEETRVVVLNGNRLEEFDFESSTKRQIKGNIYLAKVTRVEPSLQAAFVDYGGNRHGFLAFSEIHPDYYRIPVSDRPSSAHGPLPFEEPEVIADIGEEAPVPLATVLPEPVAVPDPEPVEDEPAAEETPSAEAAPPESAPIEEAAADPFAPAPEIVFQAPAALPQEPPDDEQPWLVGWQTPREAIASRAADAPAETMALNAEEDGELLLREAPYEPDEPGELPEPVETLGGDDIEEAEDHRLRALRHYKIQEVIKRRQIMLVQVTKEERGNKGAALTTYLSLAGRYCVLMPNTARGGGVSRKITSPTDRRRLKEILEDLDIPDGMGVIVRTAGAERSKPEIKRDYEYLLRLWNEIRDMTLQSTAPALIYEEGNLIKRSIRDLYSRDIDDVLVEGEEGYRTAKAFMKMLMPSHAKRVQPYRDPQIGLLHRFQVESQIDAIHSPIVQLRSGGYIVINQTEALVAIDVNSGRATRERNIEETAVRTNLEAAEEIARQLRLRDLAGLIVIDFIDMEEHRNQTAVERRLKDALKSDRARIQVGRISPFGLLEMSRQRLRPSLVEASTQPCPHCGGTGFIRSTESTALYVLRSIEEEGIRRRSAEICVYVPTTVALYILNQKRDSLGQIEARYSIRVLVARDDALVPPAFRLERLRAFEPGEVPTAAPAPLTQATVDLDDEDEEEELSEAAPSSAEAPARNGDDEHGRRRRRRRRRRPEDEHAAAAEPVEAVATNGSEEEAAAASDGETDPRRRRRSRRGGRRRPRRDGNGWENGPRPAGEMVEVVAEPEEPPDQAPEFAAPPPQWFEPQREIQIETASLPALAGDTPDATTIEAPDPEPAEPAPPTAEAEEGVPFAGYAEQTIEVIEAEVVEAVEDIPAPVAEVHEPAPPLAAAAAADMAPAPAEPPEPDDVHRVTEKPANPRRGWWQRLIQP